MNQEDFPALFQSTDSASNSYQRNFLVAFGTNLWCLSASALLSVLNFEDANFAIAQATLLMIGLASAVYMSQAKLQQIWYGNRALAESIKTLSWRYMMRSEPYDASDSESKSHFLQSIRKLFVDSRSITSHAVPTLSLDEITPKMEEIRQLDIAERSAFYEVNRIEDQLTWYTKKARFNQRRAVGWYVLVYGSYAGAILFSVMRVKAYNAPFWPTDFLTAIAGGFLAWTQTKRFQELSASYSLTSHEIGILRSELPKDGDEERFSVFVSDAENAFSREHTQWQARRDRD